MRPKPLKKRYTYHPSPTHTESFSDSDRHSAAFIDSPKPAPSGVMKGKVSQEGRRADMREKNGVLLRLRRGGGGGRRTSGVGILIRWSVRVPGMMMGLLVLAREMESVSRGLLH